MVHPYTFHPGLDISLDIQGHLFSEVFEPPNISVLVRLKKGFLSHRSSPGMTGGFWMSRVCKRSISLQFFCVFFFWGGEFHQSPPLEKINQQPPTSFDLQCSRPGVVGHGHRFPRF